MAILDHRGEPVNTGTLQQELAYASVSSVRSPFQDTIATSLTPVRLADLLQRAADGDGHDYLTLAEEMEERDPHYRSVLGTRRLAVQGLPLTVSAGDPEDKKSVEIQEAAQSILDTPAFYTALGDLLDALGKGYSVTEIMWDRDANAWTPREYKWRDPRFFLFDRDSGEEIRLITQNDPAEGEPLEPYKFMVHRPRLKSGLTLRGGLARSVAALHLYKSFALKDWIVFAEVFGLPIRLGRYDTGAHKEADIATLRTAVANIGTDAAAVIPRTMEMEFIEASRNDGEGLFSVLADWLDRQTSKVILGQTMTTDDGSSRAQAVVHDAVRSDILAADAKALSATINRDLVRPWVDLNYGPQQLYPTATLAIEEQEDLETLSKALPPFIDRGLAVEAAAIRDKFGLQEPAKDAETLEPKAGGGGGFEPASLLRALAKIGDSKGERDVIGQIAADFDDEWREVLGPLVEPIARLAETSSGYSEFKRRLPSVLRNVPSDVIVDTIATMDFMARGVGDATDSIK